MKAPHSLPTALVTLFFCFSALPGLLTAQANTYFQQRVDYDISVALDDVRHQLSAQLRLTYTNHSGDTLREIWLHCWPRAYGSDASAFARQQLRNGQTDFHFASAAERGTLDSLRFTVDGVAAEYTFGDSPDLLLLQLPSPLVPGGVVVLETPFRVQIPASFSRLGHVGESYQISQWYPKPAVYDRAGWHPLPYLDQGEFFSEFGSFRVQITLPENYVVGATGVLQEAAERTWLLEKAATDRAALAQRTDLSEGYVREPFPPSATTRKTLTYLAENVHDFAWFADKRFKVLHDTLRLSEVGAAAGAPPRPPKGGSSLAPQPPKGEQPGTTDVWAFFTESQAGLWREATDYLKRATRFYHQHIGPYPYPQVTGLQSALSAGGGMEYPMITVIGLSEDAAALDEVLAHEVGHNWFYGILASNERDHPWLDEGVNSYYEQRYMAGYYPDRSYTLPLFGAIDLNRLGYHFLARQGKDQAPDTRSDSLSYLNYGVGAYSKPSLALHELAAYVGTERLDAAVRAYYQRWQFRHPGPEDFFAVLAEELGEDFGPWFAAALTSTATSDWRVGPRTKAGTTSLAHRGPRLAPATAQISSPSGSLDTVRLHPQQRTLATGDARSVLLPPAGNPLDLYTHNNQRGGKSWQLKPGTSAERTDAKQLFVSPLLGYNAHDGLLAGLALHNRTLEPRRLEWILAPLYGTRSSELAGMAGARYRLLRPTPGIQQVLLSLGTQRFSDFTLPQTDQAYAYQRHALKAEVFFADPPITGRERRLFIQIIDLRQDRPRFENSPQPVGTQRQGNRFYRLGYTQRRDRELRPTEWSVALEYKDRDASVSSSFEASHLRLDASFRGGYQYEADRFLRYRLYGGYFLVNDLRERATYPASALALVDNGISDYRYDDLYFGRSLNASQSSWPGQQLEQRQGGFRAPIGPAFVFGRSNDFLVALNVDADLPFRPLPLGLFLDAGYYSFKATSVEPQQGIFSWVGGVSITAAAGRMGFYLPLVADPTTRNLLDQNGNVLNRLSFRLALEGWLPWRWVDGLF
ncbi:M1 family metallopeptidase [Neolewinella lacunae]|uniref:M1 family metallopeptidase n=1 Tax=Neolewinella lacunae TaxID=1517758 RepID=A0A923TEI0_9BACT|nr:M1 family metallopeptidase [Neolewinella lacunae]MBC6995937.1 M1 family metallopeptidase [Neolewinella lacunae]MDN3635219.1 M1 family metallopeptidase [Neolewinella lacunae]